MNHDYSALGLPRSQLYARNTNSQGRGDPWRDPAGFRADPGTIMGHHYRAAKFDLATFISRKYHFDDDRPQRCEQGPLLSDNISNSALTSEVVTEAESKAEHRRNMNLAACRDLLQMDLVILDDILMSFQMKTNHTALRGLILSGITNAAIILTFRYPTWSTGWNTLDNVLVVISALAAGYGQTTIYTWVLVRWCRRKANLVRNKLNAEQLGVGDQNALDGWWWSTLQLLAGTDRLGLYF